MQNRKLFKYRPLPLTHPTSGPRHSPFSTNNFHLTVSTSAHFTRTLEDFEGNTLDGSGQWYQAVQAFPGKENTLYYPVDLTAITGGSQGLTIQEAKKWCADTAPSNDCTRTHLSCPSSADENFYLWWHHPNQPFNYPHSIGVWLGIERTYDLTNGYSDWTCDGLPQDYYNWRLGGMSNKTSAQCEKRLKPCPYSINAVPAPVLGHFGTFLGR